MVMGALYLTQPENQAIMKDSIDEVKIWIEGVVIFW